MRISELTQRQSVNVAQLSRRLVGTMDHDEVQAELEAALPGVVFTVRNSSEYNLGPDQVITTGYYDPPDDEDEDTLGVDLLFDNPEDEITWNNSNRKQFLRSLKDTLEHEMLHQDQERSRQDRGYDRDSERGDRYVRDKAQPYLSVDDEIEAFAMNAADRLMRDARNDKKRAIDTLRTARNVDQIKAGMGATPDSDLARYLDSFQSGDPTLKRFLKKVVQFIQEK